MSSLSQDFHVMQSVPGPPLSDSGTGWAPMNGGDDDQAGFGILDWNGSFSHDIEWNQSSQDSRDLTTDRTFETDFDLWPICTELDEDFPMGPYLSTTSSSYSSPDMLRTSVSSSIDFGRAFSQAQSFSSTTQDIIEKLVAMKGLDLSEALITAGF